MADIFREVDEALQQEKMAKIWKEYGSTILTALVLLVVCTAAMTAYRSWDASRNADETAKLLNAVNSEAPQQEIMRVVEETRKGHAALGLMNAAALYLQEDNPEEAAKLYQQLAQTKSMPKNLRDLGRILYVQHATQPNGDILKPLLANEKSPWVWHARLQAATIAAHQQQDYAKALEYLSPFEDAETIPVSLKKRGEALAHVYQLKNSQKNNKEKTS